VALTTKELDVKIGDLVESKAGGMPEKHEAQMDVCGGEAHQTKSDGLADREARCAV
jgi:hypothetical protein